MSLADSQALPFPPGDGPGEGDLGRNEHPRPTLAQREKASEAAAVIWREVERRLAAASDWLNPILVKESRQALKSRQFAVTFVLLLAACWMVTIGGIALIGPSIYYAAGGGDMLRAYYFVLALALFVVVPFAAFRSLAAEREDNTYDVLSITTLHPRQIISGKLGSAVVQMAVYFSAVTPCLAFTYLLRGVDVPTIALLLYYSFFASLALSMIGLLLATLTRHRYHQVILSVAFVALLLWIFYASQLIADELVSNGYLIVGRREFWILNLAMANFYVTTFALAFLAAAAMITFNTENRSTPLRIAMLAQQASFIGWTGYAFVSDDAGNDRPGIAMFVAVCAGAYWWLMGMMLTGERQDVSRRVMRSLPQSFLGRVFLTWFKPGPSSGYMFAVANLLSVALLCAVVWFGGLSLAAATWITRGEFLCALAVGTSYVVGYLGLGCLAIYWLRRVTVVTMFAGVLIHLLLVLAGSGIPTSIQLMSPQLRDAPYSILQVTNPIWSFVYMLRGGASNDSITLTCVVPAATLCILLLNMPGIVRELRQVRVMLPARVARDEAELHPAPETGPQNPWD